MALPGRPKPRPVLHGPGHIQKPLEQHHHARPLDHNLVELFTRQMDKKDEATRRRAPNSEPNKIHAKQYASNLSFYLRQARIWEKLTKQEFESLSALGNSLGIGEKEFVEFLRRIDPGKFNKYLKRVYEATGQLLQQGNLPEDLLKMVGKELIARGPDALLKIIQTNSRQYIALLQHNLALHEQKQKTG